LLKLVYALALFAFLSMWGGIVACPPDNTRRYPARRSALVQLVSHLNLHALARQRRQVIRSRLHRPQRHAFGLSLPKYAIRAMISWFHDVHSVAAHLLHTYWQWYAGGGWFLGLAALFLLALCWSARLAWREERELEPARKR
jgi:hypothetical protein